MHEDDKAAAIRFIHNLVKKAMTFSKQDKILATVNQIIYFWKYIPSELKEKCWKIVLTLWNKQKFTFSTQPEKSNDYYNYLLPENSEIKRLYGALSDKDATSLLLGYKMLKLIERGQHFQSDDLKFQVENRYGKRGLSVANMVSTNDISTLVDELIGVKDKKQILKTFNFWIENYTQISLLISQDELENEIDLQKRILVATKATVKDFIIINFSGNIFQFQEIIRIIENMKKTDKINYEDFGYAELEAGLHLTFKGFIRFKS